MGGVVGWCGDGLWCGAIGAAVVAAAIAGGVVVWCGVLVAIGGGGYWGQKIYKKFQDLANSAGVPRPYRLQMGVG